MHKFFFIISLLYSSTRFENCCAHHQDVKLFYTASGIVTPVGGRPVRTGQSVTLPDVVYYNLAS